MRPIRRTAAVAVAAALAALAACGGGGEAPVEAAGDLPADTFAVVAPAVAGDDVDLAGYAGRDVVVWFWSPW